MPSTRGPTVEVAHEALIREWDLLGSWIADKREALIVRRRLEAMLQDWLDGDRADDLLPVGTRLSQFEDWIAAGEPASDYERAFVAAAVRRREAAVEARRRRRNRTIGGFAVAAVVASALAIFASIQWRAADTEATRSRARELVAVADAAAESDPELALLVALEAVDEFASIGDAVPVTAQQVLHDALASHRTVARIPGGGFFVTAKPDGSAIAAPGEDGGYAVWDVSGAEPQLTASFTPPDGLTALLAWWEDGPDLYGVVSDENETWWLAGVTPQGEWRDEGSWIAMPADLFSGDLSLDSSRFAYATQGAVTLFDTTDGAIVSTIAGDDLPTPGGLLEVLQFGPSGHFFIASVRDGPIFDLWRVDAETGTEIALIASTDIEPGSLAESPDGRILFVGGDDVAGSIDIETGRFLWRQPMILRFPFWLAEDRMVGGSDADFSVIDALTGETIRIVRGNRGPNDYAHITGTDLFAAVGNDDVALLDVGGDATPEVGSLLEFGQTTFDIAMHAESGLVVAVDRRNSVYSVADPTAEADRYRTGRPAR